MPAVPGARPRLPATWPVRGSELGRSLASQRRLPERSGPAQPAPPGGLQLSGLPRGLFPQLLPPPPEARSTRAVAAAASALPAAGTSGLSQTQSMLWKRRPSASPFSSPASSCSQTPESPEKKMREEDGPQVSGSSAPPVNKESQGEQDTTICREQNSWDSLPTPSSSQTRRRKVPLVPSRQQILLMLPPAPWIGRWITVKEYYQEKQAQSQWLKRIFEDKTALPSHGLHTPVWQALATPAPTTAITFSQSLPSTIQTAAGSRTASFGGFSGTLTTSASVTPSQPALTISSTTTPAFNIPFSSGTRPPVPSYPTAHVRSH
ncbi:hypothetical protein MUG91_G705n1 [Manis pentadactyla]|nr:hypothetical protein MUG91_G705n1 [Manis pentadactyla]